MVLLNPREAQELPSLAELRDRAAQWAKEDPDPETRAELANLLAKGEAARVELADRFSGVLEFGTAGLRGLLGAGPNRMNRVVVWWAAWAWAQELLAGVPNAAEGERRVIVGGDARRLSPEFAEDTAAILAAAGLGVVLFREPVPTPLVAFAVRWFGAAGGVVVTASHNPAAYNGYKVYGENGAQIVAPVDERIAAAMKRAPAPGEISRPPLAELRAKGRVSDASPDIARAYLDAVRSLAVHPAQGDRTMRIVYTPMHGVGDSLARQALAEAGFSRVTSVPEQQAPDRTFPTVAFPNPEEPGAMDLAFGMAAEEDAALVLANDPDADRLAVGIPSSAVAAAAKTVWRRLTGNEVGILLGHYLLTERVGATPTAVLTSIVSSPVLGKIAATLGVRYEETLTGFKWMANRAIELEREGCSVVFAYEEALGYSAGTVVRDKDGISAAVLVAEMTAVLRARGRTLEDELDAIARRWGAFASKQVNLVRTESSGAAVIGRMMDRLRAAPPSHVGDDEVVSVADYGVSARKDMRTGKESPLVLPRSNVLVFELVSGSRIVARPSGTEPKAKFYFDGSEPVGARETARDAFRRASGRLEHLSSAFMGVLERVLE